VVELQTLVSAEL